MFSARTTAGLCGLLILMAAAMPVAQSTTPTLSFSVSGTTVTLNWTAVPGATNYQLQVAGMGAPMAVGNTTTFSTAVPAGVYTVAVRATAGAQAGPFSAPVTIPVAVGPLPVPSAPTNLGAFVSGNAALLSWTNPPEAITGLVIDVIGGPLAGQALPLPAVSSQSIGPVPNGAHVLQIRALGAGGSSPASAPFTLTTPGVPCAGATTIPMTSSASYGFANIRWPQLPGVLGYQLSVLQGSVPVLTAPFAPNATSASGNAGPGTYTATLTAQFPCGAVTGATTFISSSEPPPGPRSGPGRAEPALRAMVLDAANRATAQAPGELARSCGNNAWLFRVLRILRAQDNRFGLNWKRGNFGDMSQDVIAYNYANVPDFQATAPHIFAWDVISGHCGGSPGPNAANISDPRGQAGWTILPYLQAGNQP